MRRPCRFRAWISIIRWADFGAHRRVDRHETSTVRLVGDLSAMRPARRADLSAFLGMLQKHDKISAMS